MKVTANIINMSECCLRETSPKSRHRRKEKNASHVSAHKPLCLYTSQTFLSRIVEQVSMQSHQLPLHSANLICKSNQSLFSLGLCNLNEHCTNAQVHWFSVTARWSIDYACAMKNSWQYDNGGSHEGRTNATAVTKQVCDEMFFWGKVVLIFSFTPRHRRGLLSELASYWWNEWHSRLKVSSFCQCPKRSGSLQNLLPLNVVAESDLIAFCTWVWFSLSRSLSLAISKTKTSKSNPLRTVHLHAVLNACSEAFPFSDTFVWAWHIAQCGWSQFSAGAVINAQWTDFDPSPTISCGRVIIVPCHDIKLHTTAW